MKYSTPKVLRLIEIVRQFKPRKSLNTNNKTIIIDDGDIVTQNESHQRIPYITDTPKNNKESNITRITNYSLDNNEKNVNNDDYLNENNEELLIVEYEKTVEEKQIETVKTKTSYHHHQSYKRYRKSIVKEEENFIKSQTITCFICGKLDCSGTSFEGNKNTNAIIESTENKCLNSDSLETNDELNHCSDSNSGEDRLQDSNSNQEENDSPIENIVENQDTDENGKSITETMIMEKDSIVTNNSLNNTNYLTTFTKNNNHHPRWKGRGRGWKYRRGTGSTSSRTLKHQTGEDADHLCGIIFVQHRFTAKILYHLFHVSFLKCHT